MEDQAPSPTAAPAPPSCGAARQLSPGALEALRWIDTTPHNKSEWTVRGARIRKEPPERWSHIRLSSETESILIRDIDLRQLSDLIELDPTGAKMWMLTEEGRAMLAARGAA